MDVCFQAWQLCTKSRLEVVHRSRYLRVQCDAMATTLQVAFRLQLEHGAAPVRPPLLACQTDEPGSLVAHVMQNMALSANGAVHNSVPRVRVHAHFDVVALRECCLPDHLQRLNCRDAHEVERDLALFREVARQMSMLGGSGCVCTLACTGERQEVASLLQQEHMLPYVACAGRCCDAHRVSKSLSTSAEQSRLPLAD